MPQKECVRVREWRIHDSRRILLRVNMRRKPAARSWVNTQSASGSPEERDVVSLTLESIQKTPDY